MNDVKEGAAFPVQKKTMVSFALLLFLVTYQSFVRSEEMSGQFHFEMSWDESKDKMTHHVRVTDEHGAVTVTDIDFDSGTQGVHGTGGGRFRREAAGAGYARHGPGCQKKQAQLEQAARGGGRMVGMAVHMVVMVEEGEEAKLTCHYCDEDELLGLPETQEETDEHRTSRLWYKLSHKPKGKHYQMKCSGYC